MGWLFTTWKPTAEAPSTGAVDIRTRVSCQPLAKAETIKVAKCWVAFASFSEIPSLILLTSLEMVQVRLRIKSKFERVSVFFTICLL